MSIGRTVRRDRSVRFAVTIFIALIAAGSAVAQNAPRTGHMRSVRFNKRSRLSESKVMANRFTAWGFSEPEDYNLEKESFVVYVPTNYDPSISYGLMVWIHAGNSGGSPPRAILDKHRLLWVGANRAGNKRPVLHRLGLAIDGVENMKARYNVDPERIYVSGYSGGGRCASMVAMGEADLFKGGFYICGCNSPLMVNVDKGHRKDNRYVLLTGTKDMNRAGTKRVMGAYDENGFKRIAYMEVPGMGHSVPGKDWWDKAIQVLDSPFAEKAKGFFAAALADDKKGQFGPALNGYAKAIMYGGSHDFAVQARARKKELVQQYETQLAEAQADVARKKYALAEEKAERLVKEFGSGYSVQARNLLAKLASPEIRAAMNTQRLQAQKDEAEKAAGKELTRAESLVKTDLYKGYLALKSVATTYARTTAGQQARVRAKEIASDPEQKKTLKARYDDMQAEKLMTQARNYARKKSFILSRSKLKEIIRRFPRSSVAPKAKAALAKIKHR